MPPHPPPPPLLLTTAPPHLSSIAVEVPPTIGTGSTKWTRTESEKLSNQECDTKNATKNALAPSKNRISRSKFKAA